MSDLDVLDAIHTARAIRRFKPDPVPDAVISKILDAAIRAPSAGNAQNWAFVVVRDPEQRRRLGAVYRKGSDIASAMYAARGRMTSRRTAPIPSVRPITNNGCGVGPVYSSPTAIIWSPS